MPSLRSKIKGLNPFVELIMLLMFLGAMDFFKLNYYLVFIAFAVFIVVSGRKICLNANLCVLILFSLSVLIFNSYYQQSITNIFKPFVFPIAYCIGYNIRFASASPDESRTVVQERNTEKVILIAALGSMTHFLLNAIINREASDRNVIDFWSKGESSATGQAALASIMIGVVIAFLFSNVGVGRKLIAITALAFIVAYNLVLAGRTIFVLLLIVAAFALVQKTVYTPKKLFKIVLAVLVLCIVLAVAYSNDAFGIRSAVEQSNFYDRFVGGDVVTELDDDSRLDHKIEYIKRLFDHPFGGGHIYEELKFSSHDLYFDTHDENGIFALLFIVIYIISSGVRAIKCMRNKHFSFRTRQLVACVYLSVNIIFWLEPIMRGMHWMLVAYCFIDGAVSRMLIEQRLETKKRKEEIKYEDRGN